IFAAAFAIPGFIISALNLTPEERDRIWVIYVSAFFVIFFWSAFEQAGASLTFFAEDQTDSVVNLPIPMDAVYVASAALIGVLAAVLLWGWRALREDPMSLSFILLALVLAGSGYIVYQNYVWMREGQSSLDLADINASYFQSVNAIAIVIFAPFFSAMWT